MKEHKPLTMERIDEIIKQFATIQDNGEVWGHDTEICSVDEAREDTIKIIGDAVAGLLEEIEADLKDSQDKMETVDNMKEVILNGAKSVAFQISLKRIERWLPYCIEEGKE